MRALAKRLRLVVANPEGAAVSIHLALLPRLRPEEVPLVVVVQPSELLDLSRNVHGESRDVLVVIEGVSEVGLRVAGDEAEVVDVVESHLRYRVEDLALRVPRTARPVLGRPVPEDLVSCGHV